MSKKQPAAIPRSPYVNEAAKTPYMIGQILKNRAERIAAETAPRRLIRMNPGEVADRAGR